MDEETRAARETEAPEAEVAPPHIHPHFRSGTIGYARLGVISFGLATGIAFALFVFLLGLVAALTGWGAELAGALSSLFLGYSPSVVGAITGAVWAFVDGLIGGVLIAWLYNKLLLRRINHANYL